MYFSPLCFLFVINLIGHGGLLNPDWNVFKQKNGGAKEYDETLYPLDHKQAGQIRDFSLFNHFVKPMAAGVTVTCVMDCCHSGAVLDLPYQYQPTSGGVIRMQRNMDNLTNLAFLYVLAGGLLPHHGFGNIVGFIENTTGRPLEDYQGAQGTGMEDVGADMSGFQDSGDYGDAAGGGDAMNEAAREMNENNDGVAGYDDPDTGVMGTDDAPAYGDTEVGDGDFGYGDNGPNWDGGGENVGCGDGTSCDAGEMDGEDCGVCFAEIMSALLQE